MGRLGLLSAIAAAGALAFAGFLVVGSSPRAATEAGSVLVGYRSPGALAAALRSHPARVVRSLGALHAVELRPAGDAARFARALRPLPGIAYVEAVRPRASAVEPAVVPAPDGDPYEWQFAATHENLVPDAVLRAAAAITIAVVDTGADVTAPDLAAKAPTTWSVVSGSPSVVDQNGHGTFVASLAAGAVDNGDGIAGFGGDAKLMVVQASGADGSFTDADEASAIVWAVDHGARIVNLSLGGSDTSRTERSAIDYAASHGVLLVAAAGNEGDTTNPVEYPAALLQPEGSNGQGGVGLSVAASDHDGARADFSNTGSYVSLAAPGEGVFGAVSSTSRPEAYPRVPLPGSLAGLYGYGSGTSFASPEVAGAAALVWAANPSLSATQVATILKQTASGNGQWTSDLGYGVIDVSSAVAAAAQVPIAPPRVALSGTRVGRRVQLRWSASQASAYRLSMSEDSGPAQVLLAQTTTTSASYALPFGHTFSFTVAAVDSTGAPAATSAPFTVAMVQSAARLQLAATRRSGAHPLDVVLSATLSSPVASIALGGRALVLESFDGRAWHRAAAGRTDDAGHARWSFTLDRGSYRVRARFVATPDLVAAASAPLDLRVT